MSAFKKGFTVVVPNARRSGVGEGKQGFVEVPVGEVKVRPRGNIGKGLANWIIANTWKC